MDEVAGAGETGLRARKRRETLARITETALRLFIANGYEATTLDAIAAAAGISRRTFFYYFRSKDDILLSLQNGQGAAVAASLRQELRDKAALPAIRDAIVKACARYPADEMIVIDRLMRSSEAVQARKQANYVQQERIVFDVLREKWPEPARALGLRTIAMAAIGALRLALETFNAEGGKRPLADVVQEAFAALEAEI